MATKKNIVKKESGVVYHEDKSYAVNQVAPKFDLQVKVKGYLNAFKNYEIVEQKLVALQEKKHGVFVSIDVDTSFDTIATQLAQMDSVINLLEGEQDKFLKELEEVISIMMGFLVPSFPQEEDVLAKVIVLREAMLHNKHFIKAIKQTELTNPITG